MAAFEGYPSHSCYLRWRLSVDNMPTLDQKSIRVVGGGGGGFVLMLFFFKPFFLPVAHVSRNTWGGKGGGGGWMHPQVLLKNGLTNCLLLGIANVSLLQLIGYNYVLLL